MAEMQKIGILYSKSVGGRPVEMDFAKLQKQLGDGQAPDYYGEIPDLMAEGAEGQVAQIMRSKKLDGVVLAAGSARILGERLPVIAPGVGREQVTFVNLLDHCAGVHSDAAVRERKASALLRMGLARQRVMSTIEMDKVEVFETVAVVGGGPAGLAAAAWLADRGRKVVLVESGSVLGGMAADSGDVADLVSSVEGNGSVEVLEQACITEVTGNKGRFTALISAEGQDPVEREVGAIVVTTGLAYPPGKDEPPWISYASLDEKIRKSTDSLPEDIGFIADPDTVGEYVAQHAIRTAASLASDHGKHPFLFLGDVPVRGATGQKDYEAALSAGVRFFRPDGRGVKVDVEDGKAVVKGFDIILKQEFAITCRMIVTGDRPRASEGSRQAAEVLGLKVEDDAFVQPGNITYLPTSTTRQGVLVAGAAGAETPTPQAMRSGRLAAIEADAILSPGSITVGVGDVEIDQSTCAACLTCFRLCPVGAIGVSIERNIPSISDVDCRDCGICAAACPQRAIKNFLTPELAILEMGKAALEPAPPDGPVVLALCCARSGYAAADAAGALGLDLPENVRVARVPCAGIVSTNVLLGLLNIGVDRVMVVGCPVDNCQNKHGSNLARQWVDTCRELIGNLGGDSERVSFHPIASNMPHLFAQRAAEVAGRGRDN